MKKTATLIILILILSTVLVSGCIVYDTLKDAGTLIDKQLSIPTPNPTPNATPTVTVTPTNTSTPTPTPK